MLSTVSSINFIKSHKICTELRFLGSMRHRGDDDVGGEGLPSREGHDGPPKTFVPWFFGLVVAVFIVISHAGYILKA